MHPILKEIELALKENEADAQLRYLFALQCMEEVASNLEEDVAIEAFQQFKHLVSHFNDDSKNALTKLASEMQHMAQSHPGSKSIDGTRHAAVSATYALAKAIEGDAVQAAAYAAYSSIYGYGGYAVSDPDSFSEAHEKQREKLMRLMHEKKGKPTVCISTTTASFT